MNILTILRDRRILVLTAAALLLTAGTVAAFNLWKLGLKPGLPMPQDILLVGIPAFSTILVLLAALRAKELIVEAREHNYAVRRQSVWGLFVRLIVLPMAAVFVLQALIVWVPAGMVEGGWGLKPEAYTNLAFIGLMLVLLTRSILGAGVESIR
jgi:hypothetical protein